MSAYSSLKTSFSVKKADLAAQYHLQNQDLTRHFFSHSSIPWLAIPEKTNRRVFSFVFKSVGCENLGHNRQDPILF
jgi:hypothetical protein